MGGVTPLKRPGNWGSGRQSCFTGVKTPAALAFWEKPIQRREPGMLRPLQSWQSRRPPPLPHPSQAALVEGSAQRRNLLRGGCWAMTSPFSLHGDPSGHTTIPTFWGFIGWLGWVGFFGFGGFFAFILFLHLAHAGQWSPVGSVPLPGSHALVQGSLSGGLYGLRNHF